MSAYLICLTVGGGVPLFTRKRGDLKPIPFPILASLNGVAMFGMSHDVTLVSASTTDCRIVWRDYHGSIRLIIAVPDDTLSEVHVHRLLDLIFQTLVLVVGLDELIAQRNIDRTKRDLRCCFGLIDRLLSSLSPDESLPTFGDLVGASDCVAFPESNHIQNLLEAFVEAVDSTYGCVLAQGRVASATKNWWNLHPDETVLLALYSMVDAKATLKDTPVFLPVKSPTVPFRYVIVELIQNVHLCVLCGPAPSLPEVEQHVVKVWKNSFNLLASLASILQRSFPSVSIDPSIIGFLLVNLEKRRVLASMNPSDPPPGIQKDQANEWQMNLSRKLDIIRTFYRNTVGPIFAESFVPSPHAMDQNGEFIVSHVPHVKPLHHVSETYLSAEYHKCMALQHQHFQFFVLFIAAVPNHSMRNIAHRTLGLLIRDKLFNVIR